MGILTGFSDRANFSGMTVKEQLFISKVIHRVYVKVNEEGTEANAVTADDSLSQNHAPAHRPALDGTRIDAGAVGLVAMTLAGESKLVFNC